MLTVNNNVYIIVIYVVIIVNYCKCILLYSPLNSYLYVHWILDFKYLFFYDIHWIIISIMIIVNFRIQWPTYGRSLLDGGPCYEHQT